MHIPSKFFPAIFVLPMIAIIASGALSACSAKAELTQSGGGVAMASMDGMPADVKSAPATVQQAYQFAVANPDLLEQIPCYCGCGKMGHASNYACYVQNVDEQGKITFDTHALGCSICVDIALDTRRMLERGMRIADIKATVDQTYSPYGPSNIP